MKYKDKYSSAKRKEEFFTTFTEEENKKVTDGTQLERASIKEMAKRFGIEAIIAKAEQRNIDSLALQDKLYGHDLTAGFKSKEDLLTTKNKISNLFENIPARIRKEFFNDSKVEFVNAFTTNDERKLGQLKDIGIISQTQFEQVQSYNKEANKIKQQQIKKEQFINKLNEMKEGLYEEFEKTGNINFNFNKDNTTGNTNL